MIWDDDVGCGIGTHWVIEWTKTKTKKSNFGKEENCATPKYIK